MKNLLSWKSAALMLGLIVLPAVPVAAQTSGIQADIPFAFTVSDKTLPAGAYRFDVNLHQNVVRISEPISKKVWFARVIAGGSDREPANLDRGLLRFDRHGDRYLLSGVWTAGSTRGTAVMQSRLPRELARSSGVRDVQGTR